MPQILDPNFVGLINGRGYAALQSIRRNAGNTAYEWYTPNTGTVTGVSVASANGLAGSSSGGATPILTLSTTINSNFLAGNGTAISAATMATAKVLGRATAGTGAVEELATTGTGSVVLADSPTLVTPNIGAATGTSLLTTGVLSSDTEFRLNNNSYTRVAQADGGGGFGGGYNYDQNGGFPRHDSTGAIAGCYYANSGTILWYTGGSQTAGTAATARMAILASGNVGIGTTTPGYLLHVVGDAFVRDYLKLTDSGTYISGVGGGLILNGQNGNITTGWGQTFTVYNGSGVASVILSNTAASGYSGYFKDNVGIGTTTPSAKLTIGNNIATGFLDTYAEYQILLYDAGTAADSYGFGVKSNTMVFNSGSGYCWDAGGTATVMQLTAAGHLGIGTTPSAKLTIGNNLATGFLDTYAKYQVILFDVGTATGSYGFGVKANTMIFNSGSGYCWDADGTTTVMTLSGAGTLALSGDITANNATLTGTGGNYPLTLKQETAGTANVLRWLTSASGNLLTVTPDGTNAHHTWYQNPYFNFGGSANGMTVNGILNVLGAFYPGADIGLNANTYATVGTPLTTSNTLGFNTWAWNGSNGYSIQSRPYLYAIQNSTTPGDSNLAFKEAFTGNTMMVLNGLTKAATFYGKAYFGDANLGATYNFYQSAAGTTLAVQNNGMADGNAVMVLTQGNAVTGQTFGLIVGVNTTAVSYGIYMQQNGNGNLESQMLTVGTGDVYDKKVINGVTSWADGIDNSAGDRYCFSTGGTPGYGDVLVLETDGTIRHYGDYTYFGSGQAIHIRDAGGGNGYLKTTGVFAVDADGGFMVRNTASSTTYATITANTLTMATFAFQNTNGVTVVGSQDNATCDIMSNFGSRTDVSGTKVLASIGGGPNTSFGNFVWAPNAANTGTYTGLNVGMELNAGGSNSGGTAYGIRSIFKETSVTGFSARKPFSSGTGLAGSYNETFFVDSTGNLKANGYVKAAELFAGAGSGVSYANMGGVIYSNVTPAGNAAASTTDVFSHNLAANTLGANKQSIRGRVSVKMTGNIAGGQQFKISFGATVIFDSSAVNQIGTTYLTVDYEIVRVSAGNQAATCVWSTDVVFTSVPATVAAFPAEDETTAITMKFTCTGTAANDTQVQWAKEEWLAA